jgi:hypothetical protein
MENQTNLNYNTQDVVLTPKELEGAIVNISLVTAESVFGDKAQDKEQKLIQLEIENAEHKVKHEENINYFKQGEVPDNSKLGKFLLRYGDLKVGKVVQLEKNNNGFWRVRV